jgi:hypothetical protein
MKLSVVLILISCQITYCFSITTPTEQKVLTLCCKIHTKYHVQNAELVDFKAGAVDIYSAFKVLLLWCQGSARMLVSVACLLSSRSEWRQKSTPTAQRSSALATTFRRYSVSPPVCPSAWLITIFWRALLFCVNPSACVRSCSVCNFDRPLFISLLLSFLFAYKLQLRVSDDSS